MKKSIKNKLNAPRRFARRVFSKSSNTPQAELHLQNHPSGIMTEEMAMKNEIHSLKLQIDNLKAAITTLQEDTEKKDEAIAKLAREKERITLDLLKQKRSNCSLAQQLDDERTFYYKEKEAYCQEMVEIKKLKKSLSSTTTESDGKTVEMLKSDLEKLKQTLKQTLEANYNLSIKFLRMKNTKTCLKTELKTTQLEHEKLVNDYRTKIETLSAQLNELVAEKMQAPISISSKKYLQLVKQNSCLIYENLCLQLEVDNLNLKFEKMRMEKTKSETNSRLQFIKHGHGKPEASRQQIIKKQTSSNKEHRRVRIQEETPEKLEKEHSAKKKCAKKEHQGIIKIFEKTVTSGVPQITILNENDLLEQGPSTSSKPDNNLGFHQSVGLKTKTNVKPGVERKDQLMENILSKNSSKLTIFQMSSIGSTPSSMSNNLVRVHSSPEIVQSSKFEKDE